MTGRDKDPDSTTGPSGDFDAPDPDSLETPDTNPPQQPTGPSGDFDSDDDGS